MGIAVEVAVVEVDESVGELREAVLAGGTTRIEVDVDWLVMTEDRLLVAVTMAAGMAPVSETLGV